MFLHHELVRTFINTCILREKSLAIYFGNSQLRRNGVFNFIISQNNVLTNVYAYDEINQLAFHIMLNPILSPLAKAAYLAIT